MASDPTPSPESVPPLEAQPLPGQIPSTQDDRTMALLCHLGGILTLFIVPLIIWLIKKDQSRFVDDQGKEALNFQLTLLIGDVIGVATACMFVGFVILFAVWASRIVFGIIAAVAASKGELYRYPMAIRIIK